MTSYTLSIIAEGKDNASGPLGRLSGALSGIGTIAAGILSAGVLTQLGQSIFSMGSQALAATATWERLGLAITTMTAREMRNIDTTLSQADALEKAGDKSKILLGWMQELAIHSPFDAESVAQTFKMAMTYGFTADEAQRLTQILADMSSGMGLTGAQMEGVSFALGQIHKGDKLLMQDLRQLMGVGVPVNEILETMGYGFEDIGKEAISTSDFIDAFSKMMEDDFAGSAKKAAEGWMGLTNSMSDIKQIGLREFFSSTFSAIQPYVQGFVDKFSDPAFQESLRKWGEPMGDIAKQFMEFVTNLDKFDIGDALTRGMNKFAEIDWGIISGQIIGAINNVDWAGLGTVMYEGLKAAWEYSSTEFMDFVNNTNWNGLYTTGTRALLEFLAGLTGQENWANVRTQWANNFTMLGTIIEQAKPLMAQKVKDLVGQTAISFSLGGPVLGGAILEWLPTITNTLKSFGAIFYQRAAGWLQSAINGIIANGPLLFMEIEKLMGLLKGAVKPVNFTINLPNFDHLVEQALEGAKRVQDALEGKGIKGGKSTNPNGGGESGSGGGNGNDVQSFSGGGISTGPLSGYFAQLHGSEAVIPLRNGSVPVSLNSNSVSSGSGSGRNNITNNFYIDGANDVESVAREIFRILKVQGVTA